MVGRRKCSPAPSGVRGCIGNRREWTGKGRKRAHDEERTGHGPVESVQSAPDRTVDRNDVGPVRPLLKSLDSDLSPTTDLWTFT